jgi:hypothetical protein
MPRPSAVAVELTQGASCLSPRAIRWFPPDMERFPDFYTNMYERMGMATSRFRTRMCVTGPWAEALHYLLDSDQLSDTEKEWLFGRTVQQVLRWPQNSSASMAETTWAPTSGAAPA